MDRYARQTVLDEIGTNGQTKLLNASVLVVGAGGLGCPALLYLAAAGIGRIGICDFDQIDESNLQRQILFTTEEQGQSKCEVAKTKLESLNPDCEVETIEEGLNTKNAPSLFESYDIIIDATDNFDTKYLINDAGVKYAKPIIYGAINKFDGQISVFDTRENGPCYRCLYPEKPKNHIPNCAEAGIIGAVAGTIGTMQAMEAIKLITKHENLTPLTGTVFCMDMRTMNTRTLNLEKDPNCPVCAKNREDITLPDIQPKTCAKDFDMNVKHLTTAQLKEQNNDQAILIDVREQDEWDAGHIEGARLIPLSELMDGKIPEDLQANATLLLYCRSGKRSMAAAEILHIHGFTDLTNITGGYLAWCETN